MIRSQWLRRYPLKGLFVGQLLFVLVFLFLCGDSDSPQGDFHALIIADTHVNNDEMRDQKIASFIEMINDGTWHGVDFVINLGDVVSSVYDVYDEDHPERSVHRLAKADSLFGMLNVPYYPVMGNHDYKIDQKRDSDTYFPEEEIIRMEDHWKKVTGFDPYFSVKHKGWKFIFLNSMRGRYLNRHFDPAQLDWLEEELEDRQPSVLCFHHPLQTDNIRVDAEPHDLSRPDTEPRFYDILEKHKDHIKGIFVGHGHRWIQDRLFGSIPATMVASFADSDAYETCIVGFSEKRQDIEVKKNGLAIE